MEFFTGRNIPATVVVRVGNNRPDLGTNPICNRFTGQLEEGKPLFLPCNPPMPGAFVSVHLEGANLSQLSICEAFVYTDQVSIIKVAIFEIFKTQVCGLCIFFSVAVHHVFIHTPTSVYSEMTAKNSTGLHSLL